MRHIPVLLQQIIEGLNLSEIKNGAVKPIIIDCNLGDGGHSEAIIKELSGNVHLIGVDLDPEAIERAKLNIEAMVKAQKANDSSFESPTLTFIQDNFRNLQKNIDDLQTKGGLPTDFKADAIMFDLGISS
jgi:16S rRNA (cytosine1402-N4)-methyltransferase